MTLFLSRTEGVVLESREGRERGLRNEMRGGEAMVGMINRLLGGLKVRFMELLMECEGAKWLWMVVSSIISRESEAKSDMIVSSYSVEV